MSKVELTNMVMVQNPETGEVLVQNRLKYWKGWAFPGGHIEEGESFAASAIREVKEETGLDIDNLTLCGTVQWANLDTDERYLVFLYHTTTFSGELIADHEEGQHFWATLDEFRITPAENRVKEYLDIFLNPQYSEAFCAYHEGGTQVLTLR